MGERCLCWERYAAMLASPAFARLAMQRTGQMEHTPLMSTFASKICTGLYGLTVTCSRHWRIEHARRGVIIKVNEISGTPMKAERSDGVGARFIAPRGGAVGPQPIERDGRAFPSVPDSFRAAMHRAACREAWHPQGPCRSTLPPRATTCRRTALPPDDGVMGVRAGLGARQHVVARGWVGVGPCGYQVPDRPKCVRERASPPHPTGAINRTPTHPPQCSPQLLPASRL